MRRERDESRLEVEHDGEVGVVHLEDADQGVVTLLAGELEEKREIRMELSGRAFRGYFEVGGESTNKIIDHKEGLYLSREQD